MFAMKNGIVGAVVALVSRGRVADAGRLEGRHLGEDRERGVDERHRQRGAGPLAEAQVEIEQRLRAERLQHQAVPGLDRAVRGDQVAGRVRRDAHGRQRRGAGDEAVDDDRHARRRGAQHDARQAGDLEAADLGQRVDARPRIGPVHLEAAPDDVDLAAERRVVDAGAAARDLLGRRAGEHRRERARRGGVADAHVADAEQADAVARQLVGERRARRRARPAPARASSPARA